MPAERVENQFNYYQIENSFRIKIENRQNNPPPPKTFQLQKQFHALLRFSISKIAPVKIKSRIA